MMNGDKKIHLNMDDAGYKQGQNRVIDMNSPEYDNYKPRAGDILVDPRLDLEIVVEPEKPPVEEQDVYHLPMDDFDIEHRKIAWDKKKVPIDWVLPGIRAGSIASLIGAGGAGKSMLALQMSLYVALGVDTLDLGALHKRMRSTPTHGSVIYFSGEDDQVTVTNRLSDIFRVHEKRVKESGAEFEDFVEKVDVKFMREIVDITNPRVQDALLPFIEDKRLCIIDTLRVFNRGNENDALEMAILISVLKNLALKTETTILFLHHTNKSAVLNGHAELQQAVRGSSVLTDNIRCQLNLFGMSKDEAKDYNINDEMRKNYLRLAYAKSNLSRGDDDLWFRRDEHTGVLCPVGLYKIPKDSAKGGKDEKAAVINDKSFFSK